MKLSNIHKPTSAKYVKLGASLLAVSQFISTYAFTQNNNIAGWSGLIIGVLGTMVVTFFSE